MLNPGRPLLTADFARSILDCSNEHLTDLIDEGLIQPVWNICTPGAKLRELRILAAGLLFYQTTQRPLPADPKEVAGDIFAPDALITTATLQRVLNCHHQHVSQLIALKSLTLAPGETMRRGRNGFAKVTRSSCLAFLEKRLVI
ncbi:MAG TPA: hypothetical protein VFB72_19765 [Verrucomicrobiae bacterium]|nr:hypothetical protein [Verrucomicrobiae bacterium]